MVRPTFDQFRKKALIKSGVKAEYEAFAPVCEINRQMIVLRQAAGASLRTRMAQRRHEAATAAPEGHV